MKIIQVRFITYILLNYHLQDKFKKPNNTIYIFSQIYQSLRKIYLTSYKPKVLYCHFYLYCTALANMDKTLMCEEMGNKISIEVLVFTFTTMNYGNIRFDNKERIGKHCICIKENCKNSDQYILYKNIKITEFVEGYAQS